MEGVKDEQGEPWHSCAVRTEGELARSGEAVAADAQHPGHSGSEGNPGWALRKGICALFWEAPPGKVAPHPAAVQEKLF